MKDMLTKLSDYFGIKNLTEAKHESENLQQNELQRTW